MLKTKKIKAKNILIECDNIEECLEYCLPRIRDISKEYYGKEIRKDLEVKGYSWIDYHAGMKITYDIKLVTTHIFEERETLKGNKLLVCANCGVTKNKFTATSKCTKKEVKPLEKLLKPKELEDKFIKA